jgi:hypothetical protein
MTSVCLQCLELITLSLMASPCYTFPDFSSAALLAKVAVVHKRVRGCKTLDGEKLTDVCLQMSTCTLLD